MVRRSIALAFVAVTLIAACHKSKSYTANVEITRIQAVRKDASGVPLTLDFEFSYAECPGTQIEVIRGNRDFAACVARYKVGDKVTLGIDHLWSDEGHYKWNVTKVGDCARLIDPDDEASFAMVRECADWKVNDQRVGFQCKYVPEQALLDKCPWFQRR